MGELFISRQDYPDLVQEFQESRFFRVIDLRADGMRATFKKELRRGLTHLIYDAEGGDEDMMPPLLLAGIYGEGDHHSRENFLEQRELVLNSFHRDDYESGAFNREPAEDFERLFNLNTPRNIWEERVQSLKDLPPIDGYERYCERYSRWTMLVERLLPTLFVWLQDEAAPAITPHTTRGGRRTFKFKNPTNVLSHLSNGSPVMILSVLRARILHAGWYLMMIQRYKFNQATPGRTWLSAEHMHILREVFNGLADHFSISQADRPQIVEKLKVEEKRQKLVTELAYLNDLQDRAIARMRHLAWESKLGGKTLKTAIIFLNEVAEKIDRTQDLLNLVVARMMVAEEPEDLDTKLVDG